MVLKFIWLVFDQRWERILESGKTETSPSFVFPNDVSAVGPQQR